MRRASSVLGLVCALAVGLASAAHRDHSYKPQEPVALYANKAGPFHNPRRAHCLRAAVQLLCELTPHVYPQ